MEASLRIQKYIKKNTSNRAQKLICEFPSANINILGNTMLILKENVLIDSLVLHGQNTTSAFSDHTLVIFKSENSNGYNMWRFRVHDDAKKDEVENFLKRMKSVTKFYSTEDNKNVPNNMMETDTDSSIYDSVPVMKQKPPPDQRYSVMRENLAFSTCNMETDSCTSVEPDINNSVNLLKKYGIKNTKTYRTANKSFEIPSRDIKNAPNNIWDTDTDSIIYNSVPVLKDPTSDQRNVIMRTNPVLPTCNMETNSCISVETDINNSVAIFRDLQINYTKRIRTEHENLQIPSIDETNFVLESDKISQPNASLSRNSQLNNFSLRKMTAAVCLSEPSSVGHLLIRKVFDQLGEETMIPILSDEKFDCHFKEFERAIEAGMECLGSRTKKGKKCAMRLENRQSVANCTSKNCLRESKRFYKSFVRSEIFLRFLEGVLSLRKQDKIVRPL